MFDKIISKIKRLVNHLYQHYRRIYPVSTFLNDFDELTNMAYYRDARHLLVDLRNLFGRTPNLEQELRIHNEHIFETMLKICFVLDMPYAEFLLEFFLEHHYFIRHITKQRLQQIFNTLAYKKEPAMGYINVLLQNRSLMRVLISDPTAIQSYHFLNSDKLFQSLLQNAAFKKRIYELNFEEIARAVKDCNPATLKRLIQIPEIMNRIKAHCANNIENVRIILGLTGQLDDLQYINSTSIQLLPIYEIFYYINEIRDELLVKAIKDPQLLDQLLKIPAVTYQLPESTLNTLFIKAMESSTQSYRIENTSCLAFKHLLSVNEWKLHAIKHREKLLHSALQYPEALKVLLDIPQIKEAAPNKNNALFRASIKYATQKPTYLPYLNSAEILFELPSVRALIPNNNNKIYRILSDADSGWNQQFDKRPSPYIKLMNLLLTIPAVRHYANPYNASRLLQSFDSARPEQVKLIELFQPILNSNQPNGKKHSHRS